MKNDDVAEKAEFKDRDYTFIKLYKDECIKGTKLFLQFLQDNKDKIENIHIEGAEVINSTFIRRIKNGKQFTKPDFYTAKQDENCQWYGVINNYDVVRNDYGKVKTIASSCFDKPRTYKVVAVVHGFGGCGKSTLLRRLAVELCNESFKFIWVKDRGFENFTDNGLIQIQEDRFRNYLVIIEDWYRLTDNLKEKAKEFLLKTQAINNIRVIIGDRETSGKEYINNLPDPLNVFHLQSTENEKIIAEIMELHTEWKDAKEKVTKKQEYYNTSLFLLLFVIARVSNEKFDPMEIDFSEPGLAFKSIVKSDLKKINAVYPGMAKALHNWACIYTNHKIFIDFDTFLKIADTYNENDKVSNAFTSWNARSTILERVKSYINKGRNTSLRNKKLQQIDFVQFNHDKLAEEGLAGVILDGWLEFYNPVTKKYDDLLLKQFLNIVIDNYAPSYDNFSSFF
ncbi:MAG: hypothetical protein IPH11_17775 [Ignavibacteriales bacterium]|nr:hypothetical protein [Ignavibacteriales bacterium]